MSRPKKKPDLSKRRKDNQLGNTWVNAKGQILIYKGGRELNVSNWQLLNAIL